MVNTSVPYNERNRASPGTTYILSSHKTQRHAETRHRSERAPGATFLRTHGRGNGGQRVRAELLWLNLTFYQREKIVLLGEARGVLDRGCGSTQQAKFCLENLVSPLYGVWQQLMQPRSEARAPSVCILCLHSLEERIRGQTLYWWLEPHLPILYDAYVREVARVINDAYLAELEVNLLEATRSCLAGTYHSVADLPLGDFRHVAANLYLENWEARVVEIFYDAIIYRLSMTLLEKSAGHSGLFKHSRGLHHLDDNNKWPSHVYELFPAGSSDEKVVDGLLHHSLRFRNRAAATTLMMYLSLARPLVWPHLMSSALKPNFISLLTGLLRGDLSATVTSRPSGQPGAIILRTSRLQTLDFDPAAMRALGIAFVMSSTSGIDADPSSAFMFAAGYERSVFDALQYVIEHHDFGTQDQRSKSQKRELDILCDRTLVLHEELKKCHDVAALLPQVKRYYNRRRHQIGAFPNLFHQAMRCVNAAAHRICGFFECGKHINDMDNPMQVCGRCMIIRYCSRDCQRRGWKDGPRSVVPWVGEGIIHTHRDVCTLLQKFPRQHIEHPRSEGFIRALQAAGLTLEDWRHMLGWIFALKVLMPEHAIKLLGVVSTIVRYDLFSCQLSLRIRQKLVSTSSRI